MSIKLTLDELVKSQKDGKVKNSSSRRREFCGMRRTYVHRSEHERKRNEEIGLFTKPSHFIGLCMLHRGKIIERCQFN